MQNSIEIKKGYQGGLLKRILIGSKSDADVGNSTNSQSRDPNRSRHESREESRMLSRKNKARLQGFLRNRKKLLAAATITTIFILFNLVAWLYMRGEIFQLSRVEVSQSVESSKYINRDELTSSILSKHRGAGIFTLSTDAIEAEILHENRYIKDVSVRSNRFNTVVISYEEESPEIILKVEDRCILSSYSRKVLEITEEDSECSEISLKHPGVMIITDPQVKEIFTLGETSTYFNIERFILVDRVLRDFAVISKSMVIEDNILRVTDENDLIYIFSFNIDLDLQLKRFIAVMGELKTTFLPYESIDFRYERPVLISKE